MKTPFLNRKSKGFTLIELLVVIAIILTLAGIAMTVVNGVMEKSKVTTARSDCNGLQTAVENYMLDNGRVPVAWSSREMTKQAHKDGQYYVTTAVDDDSRIMSILTNYMDRADEDRKLNPKKTAYFNTTTTDVEGAPGLFFESRGRVGLKDPKRPIGSFLFLGPTGVGKTELCKALAEAMFGDENAMIRIDMSEYMERHTVSRLVGSPPGYVGHEEGGQLTEKVRRKPYSVVLFDEIEKAHEDVWNILLQILEDGVVTDSQGRRVDFKNTVIVMTSNVGARNITDAAAKLGFDGDEKGGKETEEARFARIREAVMTDLKHTFRPEFLNRLDEIVYYKSLTKDEMRKIVDLQLQDLRNRMEEGKHLKLEVTTAAKDFIIDSAYDSVYGARPIKRFIQSRVETLIAKAIIRGDYAEGTTLTVDYDGSALILR